MLLVLPKAEYLPALDAMSGRVEFSDFVCTLGQYIHEARHAVQAAPLLLDRLSAWPDLSRQQRAALAAAAQAAVHRPLPTDEVTDAVAVTGPAGVIATSPSGVRWHRMDWSRLRSADALDRVFLVGEHTHDAQWYAWLARAWSARLRPASARPGAEVGIVPSLGGGNTTHAQVQTLIEQRHPTLCILDSDRDRADGHVGDPVKQVERVLRGMTSEMPPAHLEVLGARDVENLLPYPLLARACRGSAWLDPMIARGFFVGPDRALDATLAWIDVGKDQCPVRLTHVKDPATRALRQAAIEHIRALDDSCDGVPCPNGTDGEAACLARGADGKWQAVPAGCALVHSVGKAALRQAVDHLDGDATRDATARDGAPSAAHWLASILPADEPAVWEPARRAWSWGLRMPRAVR